MNKFSINKKEFLALTLCGISILASHSSYAAEPKPNVPQTNEPQAKTEVRAPAQASELNVPADIHKVKKSETLSKIAKELSGNAQDWHKIWELNQEAIPNPDLIYPGEELKLNGFAVTPSNLANTSSINMPASGSGASSGSGVLGEEDKNSNSSKKRGLKKITGSNVKNEFAAKSQEPNFDRTHDGELVPRTKIKVRKMLPFPESLPNWQLVKEEPPPKPKEPTLDFDFKAPPKLPSITYLTQWVEEKAPEFVGEVVGVESGYNVGSDFMDIYVRISNPTDKNYIVVQNKAKFHDPESFLGGSKVILEAQGTIELLDKVNSAESVYRARVKKAIYQVQKGASLLAGNLETLDLSETLPNSQGEARIIGGESNREIFGKGDLVFLNIGTTKGLQLGGVLPVYANEKIRDPDSLVEFNESQVGAIRLVKVNENVATGVVIRSRSEIHVGDRTYSNVEGAEVSAAPAAVQNAPAPSEDAPGEAAPEDIE